MKVTKAAFVDFWRSGHGRFIILLLPAAIAGALLDGLDVPLGWLLGAALVTASVAVSGRTQEVPRLPFAIALIVIGTGVGVSMTPEAAGELVRWLPVMVLAAALGVALSVAVSPVVARTARVSLPTAFFSLLPGGIIEMANVAEKHGGDRAVITSLHAVRIALIVAAIPLGISILYGSDQSVVVQAAGFDDVNGSFLILLIVLIFGAVGGWVGNRFRLPAGWLWGAFCTVGLWSGLGLPSTALPESALIAAQLLVGMSLGARFKRESLIAIPRALVFGCAALCGIMALMASAGVAATFVVPETASTLILCFGIGGMAEMVLTAKAFGQNAAMVAAFQAVRGILVNATAGVIWSQFSKLHPQASHSPESQSKTR